MPTPAKQAARPAAKPTQKAATHATRPQATVVRPPAPAAKVPPAPAPRPQSTAVTTPRQNALAIATDVPDYINQSTARGSENVEMQDMVIPRIELVQALSKCLKEGSGEYIEGARPGVLYNSVTRELYGMQVTVCPAFFKKQWLAWREMAKGGGFAGAHDSLAAADEQIATQEHPDEWEAIETAQQIVLVVNMESGEMSEAVISCARTKMKISRQWNSMIRSLSLDRFSRIYELFSTDETNNNNQDYKNIAIRPLGFAPVEVYKRAEALYTSIASGVRDVKIDDNYDDAVIDGQADSNGDPGASSEY